MFSTLVYAFDAVMPLVLIIFVGAWLRRIGLFTDHFLSVGYKFSFRIALPCMLFCNVYAIKSIQDIDFSTVLYAVLAIVGLFLVGLVLVTLFVRDDRQRGVILQCIFRSNCAVVGVPLTESLGGSAAVQCVAIITAFTIPLFNILAVVSLSVFCGEKKEGKSGFLAIDWKKIGLNIVKNPLIIGIAAGVLCLALRGLIPVGADGEKVFLLSKQTGVLFSVVESIAKIASPFMLLMLGGQFTFSAVKGLKRQIVFGTVARILVAPLLAIGIGWLLSEQFGILHLAAAEYASFISLFATPVAVSSAIMAREMKNDEILAGQLVVWTSVFSVITLFLFAFGCRFMGLL
ncbi:MAG: AEC family transporter [Clostridia bacterium]|nr:AEC family transporter [Clostridia bacterium]